MYKFREYKGEKFKNNSVWKTNSDGNITIIGNIDKKHKKVHKWFLCKFDDGTLVVAEYSAIDKGKIANPNKPRVYGYGFVGQGKYVAYLKGNIKTKQYRLWEAMLNRCYGKYSSNNSYVDYISDDDIRMYNEVFDSVDNELLIEVEAKSKEKAIEKILA